MKIAGRIWQLAGSGLVLTLAGCHTVASHYVGEGAELDTAPGGISLVVQPPPPPPIIGQGRGDRAESRHRTVVPRQDGISYFLPRQLAKVTAKRTEKKLDEAIKATETKQDDLRKAEAKVSGAKVAIEKTENDIIAAAGGDAARKILADRLAAQQGELAEAETAKTKAKEAFDRAKADLKETIAVRRAEQRYLDTQNQAEKRVADLSTEIGKLDAIVNGPPPGGTPKERIALAAKQVELVQAQKDLNKIKALAVAKADAAAIAAETPEPRTAEYSVTLKIELQAPSADPAQAFRLDPRHSVMRDDEHKLTVSAAGLLSTADVTATDRSADIVVEIATFAGAIAGLSTGTPGFRDGDKEVVRPEKYCDKAPNDYIGLVDFADASSVQRLNRDLQCLGVRVAAEGRYWQGGTRPVESQPGQGINGIVYRMPVDVQVRIERCTDKGGECANENDWFPTEMLALSLPQAGPISFIRQRAGIATKTKYASVFKDGILTSYEDNRPSEALQIASTPMRVIDGVFGGISKVISLRTGQNNALAGLSASQLAVLNAQVGYEAGQINGQRQLSEAERTLLESRIALQAAATNGERTLTEAQIALLEKQVALQTGQLNGQASVSAAQLALSQSQAGLTIGNNTLQSQLSASELALAIALLRDRAKTQALSQCIAEHGPTAVDICLP